MIKKHRYNSGGAHVDPGGEENADRTESKKVRKAPVKGARTDRSQAAEARKAEREAKKSAAAAKKAERAEKRAQSFKKLRRALIIVACALAVLTAGAAVGGYYVTKSETNLPKIYVEGIFVGGMTKEETLAKLDEHSWDEDAGIAMRVRLPAGVSFKLDVCEAGAMLTKEAAAAAAYDYGHSGNWFSNLFRYIGNCLIKTDVAERNSKLDQSYIRDCAEKGIEKFRKTTADNGYTVLERQAVLRMLKGAGQMEIDLDKLCGEISAALLEGGKLLEYDHIDNSLTAPDFKKLHEELGVEPKDAEYDADFNVVAETVGCSFDVEQAESIWEAAAPGETIRIPLDISYPEKTAEYLKSLLYRDKLGSQTTYYTYSSDNRINNIKLAAEKLNGLILKPGETFSYNGTVGQRTADAGFLEAGAYNDGQVVQEIGGGICQVSSTLYCAAMFAQLETVERTSHYFMVSYLELGLDATVSWPGPDYKFKNTRDYPIKVVAVCDNEGKALTIEIWGTDVDGSYVELSHKTGVIYDQTYTDVAVGYGVSAYRSVYDKNGTFLYQVQEPYGIYHFHDEDIDWPASKTEGDAAGGSTNGTGGSSAEIVPTE